MGGAHLGVAVEDGAPREARGRHDGKHAHQVEHNPEEVQEEVLRALVRQNLHETINTTEVAVSFQRVLVSVLSTLSTTR